MLAVVAVAAGGVIYLERPRPPATTYDAPPPARQYRNVTVYVYDADRDTDAAGNVGCTSAGLVGVRRTVPQTDSALADAVREQLAGKLTGNEKLSGFTTEFPLPGVSLASADLADGVATLVIEDQLSRTSGGSCRVSIMRAQLEAAAAQVPGVREVRILPPEVLQP